MKARHRMQSIAGGELARVFERVLELRAVFDDLRPERIAAFFSGLLPCGTTITARTPRRRAFHAID